MNIIPFDFSNFVKINTKGLDIEITTKERVVCIKNILWIMKESDLEIIFYTTTKNDSLRLFLEKSLIINIETLFLFFLQEAKLRYLLINMKNVKSIKETEKMLNMFEKKYNQKIKEFNINKEKNKEIRLAKLRLLYCCYERNVIKEDDLEKFLNLNIINN